MTTKEQQEESDDRERRYRDRYGQPVTSIYDLAYRVAREWGIFAAMTMFFVWSGYNRERELTDRISENEKYIRESYRVTIDSNTKVMSLVVRHLEQLHEKIDLENVTP